MIQVSLRFRSAVYMCSPNIYFILNISMTEHVLNQACTAQ